VSLGYLCLVWGVAIVTNSLHRFPDGVPAYPWVVIGCFRGVIWCLWVVHFSGAFPSVVGLPLGVSGVLG
jgi:energy-converting hydrogenase Eha subunit G